MSKCRAAKSNFSSSKEWDIVTEFVPFLYSTQRLRSSWIVLWSTDTIGNLKIKGSPYTLVHIIPESAKPEVLFKNFYETTAEVSSGPDEAQHTPNMVHKVEVMTTKPGKLASRSGSKRKDVG